MLDEMSAAEAGRPRSRRRRRLAVAVSVAAMVGASSVLAASSASAAPGCGSYHSWSGCVGYNGTAYTYSIRNGYSVLETETFSISVDGTKESWVDFTIGVGQTLTFTWVRDIAAGEVCGEVDSATIACQDYS